MRFVNTNESLTAQLKNTKTKKLSISLKTGLSLFLPLLRSFSSSSFDLVSAVVRRCWDEPVEALEHGDTLLDSVERYVRMLSAVLLHGVHRELLGRLEDNLAPPEVLHIYAPQERLPVILIGYSVN